MKIKFGLAFILSLFLVFPNKCQAVMNEVLVVGRENIAKKELQNGEVISQIFTSPVDDFGIVTVKLARNKGVEDDKVIFRIKEVNSEEWYYQVEVSTKDFRQEWFYPFGFPTIEDSINKDYIFELEFLSEDKDSRLFYFQSGEDIVFTVANNRPIHQAVFKDFINNIQSDIVFFAAWGLLILLPAGYIIKK